MKKSKFNLSHPASFTAKMGNLIPFCVLDCLPGDTHRIGARSFIRVQPMLAPLMHQVNFFTQYWFVPYRILWNDWQDFITGGNSGTEAPTFPTIKITPEVSTLADYFGLPTNGKELEVSALPFRAYAEIWNTRYRDEDLQLELPISYESGEDTITSKELKKCSWAKDYFTTSRPFTQRGAQISVPVNSYSVGSTQNYSADIRLQSSSLNFSYQQNSAMNIVLKSAKIYLVKSAFSDSFNISQNTFYVDVNISGSGSFPSGNPDQTDSKVVSAFNGIFRIDFVFGATGGHHESKPFTYNYSGHFIVNLGNFIVSDSLVSSDDLLLSSKPASIVFKSNVASQSVNIRDLRLAGAIQRYQEKSMEWGNRYEEFIQREFKIRPRDARIQRPEYLGGAKTRLQISEVLQTAEGTDTGVGTMRGHGVGALSSRRIKFTCPEHGIIIGLFSIRPHSITTQGLNRFWRKFSKFDFFTPELANIGMQEVFQSELYADGKNYDTVFGYSNRYDEYRKIPARISGEFRSTLDYWNLARKFENPPVLNSSFIEMNPSTRIFAEQTTDQFLVMLQNDIFSYRPVPKRAKNILM